MNDEPSFSLGIEEEYLLVDTETFDLVAAPDVLMAACVAELEEKVSPEFLQCQIEVGTGVCATIAQAREDLANLRRTVARLAGEHGIAPIAASTHPFAKWDEQSFTDKSRYRSLEKDMAGVARRMLICGMHVHVGIDDDDLRADLLGQFAYFLPHLLALSTSSPFWEGRQTGLKSYRLTVFDNLPRTGLPPRFASFAEYRRSVDAIIASGSIEDATKIWWDCRPSDRYPTLESRICDVCPRLDDTIALAALTQCTMRMLWHMRRSNLRWRDYDRFLIDENRWRAQRYGVSDGLIDFGAGQVKPCADLIDELMGLLAPHADALGCTADVQSVREIVTRGTGADRQIATYEQALTRGDNEDDALRAVVSHLVDTFSEGL